MKHRYLIISFAMAAAGCLRAQKTRGGHLETDGAASAPPPPAAKSPLASAFAPGSSALTPSWTAYPWLQSAPTQAESPAPAETLLGRFPTPPSATRASVAADSWEAWLRDLPLAASGTPVRSYRGDVLLAAEHPNVAAVVAIDPGRQDLQQCADSILRLQGEWRWARGDRDMTFRAASGTPLPFHRWQQGERPLPVDNGRTLRWTPQRKAQPATYEMFRSYLDAVFAYANTGSLVAQSQQVLPSDLRAGDFFVEAGSPGHAVLILDVVQEANGQKYALLAQGFMPAQNLHVLRPGEGSSPWFVLDETRSAVVTPFWKPFVWGSLRRLSR